MYKWSRIKILIALGVLALIVAPVCTITRQAFAADTLDSATTEAATHHIWLNDTTDTEFATINEAVSAAQAGDVVHISGDFTAALDAVANTVVNKALTLDVAADTTLIGTLSDATYNKGATDAIDGIRLKAGSRIRVAAGATLTMKYFNRALVVDSNAAIGDGSYVLSKNSQGVYLEGGAIVTGSSNRESISIRSTDSFEALKYKSSLIKNATVYVEYASGGTDSYSWHFENVSFTTKNLWVYLGAFSVKDSDVLYVGPASSSMRQGITFEGPFNVENSTITIDGNNRYMLSALISHTSRADQVGTPSRLVGSRLIMQNSRGFGGYNLAYASLDVIDSEVSAYNVGSAAMGTNYRGYDETNTIRVKFEGNSTFNTAGTSSGDAVGANPGTTNPTIVMGGAFKWNWNPNNPSVGNTPVNDEANGSERLTLLELADTSMTELSPMNKVGVRYTYPVANATDDGAKRVWVPGVKVSFMLSNDNAHFADGTSANKVYRTARGYALGLVKDNEVPADPTDKNGINFLGWYYRDASGAETKFTSDVVFTQDTEVYAKWASKFVIYHNQREVAFDQAIAKTDAQAPVLSFDDVVAAKSEFAVAGKEFVSWNTLPDGSGQSYQAGDMLDLAAEDARVDLYAQYTDKEYTVTFSANGGIFSPESLFVKHADAFDLVKDADGNVIAARLKTKALYNQKLRDLLPENISHNDLRVQSNTATRFGSILKTDYWYKGVDGSGSTRFYDTSFFGIPLRGENPAITDDTTYYLGWNEDSSIKTDRHLDLTLSADMYGDRPAASNTFSYVFPKEDELSITGLVDVSSIKTQIQEIRNKYGEGISSSEISLRDLSSSFTTMLTVPAGIQVDSEKVTKDSIIVRGLGDCFAVSSVELKGQVVEVVFTLKNGITNLAQLEEAVTSTGVPAPSEDTAGARRTRRDMGTGDYIYITLDKALRVAKDVVPGSSLVATGTVEGDFFAYATHGDSTYRFNYAWNAVQNETGKDADIQGSDSTIAYEWRVPNRVDLKLPGDLLNGEDDTEFDHSVVVDRTEKFALKGKLDVRSIKAQIKQIKDDYENESQNSAEDVDVDKVQSEFTTTLTLDPHYVIAREYTEDEINSSFNGGDLFKVSSVTTDRDTHTITIVMSLKKTYKHFMDLYRDVTAVDDNLEVTVPDLSIVEDTAAHTAYTAIGKVTGEFKGVGIRQSTNQQRGFYFGWDSEQMHAPTEGTQEPDNPNGRDFLQAASDTTTIGYSVLVPELATLEGDMLYSKDDTVNSEETEVPTFTRDETFSLIGRIYTQTVKDQIEAIKKQYPSVPTNEIALSNVKSSFDVTLTVPDDLVLPETLVANDNVVFSDNELFGLESVTKDGSRIHAKLTLKKNYDNFEALYSDVMAASEYFDLKVSPVGFAADAELGKNLTSSGQVHGSFDGDASYSGQARGFHFVWDATQKEGLKDVTQTDNDFAIRLTVAPKARPVTIQIKYRRQGSEDEWLQDDSSYTGLEEAAYDVMSAEYLPAEIEKDGKVYRFVQEAKDEGLLPGKGTLSREGTVIFEYKLVEVPTPEEKPAPGTEPTHNEQLKGAAPVKKAVLPKTGDVGSGIAMSLTFVSALGLLAAGLMRRSVKK